MPRKPSNKSAGLNIANTRAQLASLIPDVAVDLEGDGVSPIDAHVDSIGNTCMGIGCRRCAVAFALMTLQMHESERKGPRRAALLDVDAKAEAAKRPLQALAESLAVFAPQSRETHDATARLGSRGHDHEALCAAPARTWTVCLQLLAELESLGPGLRRQLFSSENAQRATTKPQQLLIATLYAILIDGGFTLEEIATLVDDGGGGTKRQRMDRARKRWKASRGKFSREDSSASER
jgi:hypothetical protein